MRAPHRRDRRRRLGRAREDEPQVAGAFGQRDEDLIGLGRNANVLDVGDGSRPIEPHDVAQDTAPWPGELGQRIYENVSVDAWKLWEDRMKMILNEYRLMPWQKEAQDLVAKHTEDFFFGESAALPPGYVPQQAK